MLKQKKKYKSIYSKDESKMLRDKIYKTATAEQTQKKVPTATAGKRPCMAVTTWRTPSGHSLWLSLCLENHKAHLKVQFMNKSSTVAKSNKSSKS